VTANRVSFGGNKNVLILIVVMVTQLCDYAKNHSIVQFKLVNCMICKLYLKADLKQKHLSPAPIFSQIPDLCFIYKGGTPPKLHISKIEPIQPNE